MTTIYLAHCQDHIHPESNEILGAYTNFESAWTKCQHAEAKYKEELHLYKSRYYSVEVVELSGDIE